MNEDIEILESIVKVHNDFLKGCNNETINEKEIQAIENVLNRVKELEEQNKQLTDAYLIQKDLINADFLSDYVSKDKIKEKLSKLEKEFDFYAGRDPFEWEDAEFDGEQCDDIAIKIGVLKELLKEE